MRTKIETGAIVWSPHESTYVLLLEKVQKAFLRFLYKKKFGYYPFMYPTKYLLGMLGFNSLEVRRDCEQLVAACRMLRGESDCPQLTNQVCRLFVPDKYLRTRKHVLLSVPASHTVARSMSPLVRARSSLNTLLSSVPECDLFADRLMTVSEKCLAFCERDE